MKLFSPIQPQPLRPETIPAPGLAGLEVLPYLRSRLVFAHLAAVLLEQTDYDLVLVDLPQFMNKGNWLNTPLGLFPALSLAIFQRQDGELRAISLAPNDAAGAAVCTAKLTDKKWRAIDDPDLLNYPPAGILAPPLEVGDDLQVRHLGLAGYFRPLWEQLDRVWETAGAEEQFFTRYRAQKVAAEVLRQHRPGRKTLLVCEYQLWWRLRQALQEGPEEQLRYIFRWQEAPGVFRVEDPYFAWEHGLLDDYPAVNLAFWQCLKAGRAHEFDKIGAFEKLLGEFFLGSTRVVEAGEPEGGNVISLQRYLKKLGKKFRAGRKKAAVDQTPPLSIRRLFDFAMYLRKLTWMHQRLLPEPGSQFFHAAQAFGDGALHRELARKFLEYPENLNRSQINLILQQGGSLVIGGLGLEVPAYDQLPSFFTGRPFASLWRGEHRFPDAVEREARRRTLERVHPRLTAAEKRELEAADRGTYIRWEVIEDFQHQAQACSHIRSLVPLLQQQCVPKRSWGGMGEGIHWKATLAAWARGEQALYVNQRSRPEPRNFSLNEHTPITFLLAPEAEIDDSYGLTIFDQNESQRIIDLGQNVNPEQLPKPDKVFSVFLTSRLGSRLWEEHVEQEDLTSLTTLYSKAAMGLDRYHAIRRLPEKLQCRLSPSYDPELKDFPLSRKGIAWALKYAPEVVIVAARPDWQPSAQLQDFSRQQGKKIIRVSLSQFRPEFLARLARIFLLSTRLKNHPRHAEIARRFIF